MEKLIGRQEELKLLESLKNRNRSDFVAMITTYGLTGNNPETGLVQNELTMDILFA
jgi:hypothetical protein